MNYGDLILAPIFLGLLYLYFRRQRNKITDPLLQKYHRQGFWIKMIGCVAFFMYSVYIYPADSIGLYQTEGNNIYHLILTNSRHFHWLLQKGKYFDESYLKNPYNTGYSKSEANFMVIRIVALLSFLTAGRYAAISFLFAGIAFSGVWKLYLFFYEQNPKLHRQFAIAILYFPTFIFWSSGVLKDTLSIASMGWITYGLYSVVYLRKKVIKYTLTTLFFAYLLATLKIYILISYTPFLLLYLFLKRLNVIRNGFVKLMLAPLVVIGLVIGFTLFLNSNENALGRYAIDDLASSIETLNGAYKSMDGNSTADSNFDLGVQFDGTPEGLIRIAPVAVFTTFFRPFIWESHKMSQMIASAENLLLILFLFWVILKAGPFSILRMILTDPLITFCFLFSIVFAVFVGASTLNFGTLVRYKIPALPFFTISLFLMYDKAKERALRKKEARARAAESVAPGSLTASLQPG